LNVRHGLAANNDLKLGLVGDAYQIGGAFHGCECAIIPTKIDSRLIYVLLRLHGHFSNFGGDVRGESDGPILVITRRLDIENLLHLLKHEMTITTLADSSRQNQNRPVVSV
jgi:hypothetical protein